MTPNRLPNGWVVLGGSVLASFIWWMASRPSTVVAPAPVPATAPATVEATPVAEAPATRSLPPSKPRASAEAPAPEPPPEPAPEATAPLPLLRVGGDVAGANVFIDRKYVGKTPFETRDVTAGGHQINVSAEGYDGMSRHVEVAADTPTDVSFSLKAIVLESAVQVVHKHRLGSCAGRLSADLTGLRYAPTSGDDAFHAPLGGLESLAVDYKEKVLRLKLKSGKSFNFTTKAATADPLLAFHRNVEKARKKLAGGA